MEGYKFVFCNAYKCCLALIKLEILPGAPVVYPVVGQIEPFVESSLRYLASPSYIYSKKHRCGVAKFVEVIDYYDLTFDHDISVNDDPFPLLPDTVTYITLISPKPIVDPSITTFASIADPQFVYHWGKVTMSDVDADFHKECAEGIHFFDRPEDAVEWMTKVVNPHWLLDRWNAFSRLT